MYRDSRASVVARIAAIEEELEEAEPAFDRARKEATWSRLVFPFFVGFGATSRSLREQEDSRWLHYTIVIPMYLVGVVAISIVYLPIVVTTVGRRDIRRRARRAARRVARLRGELEEHRRTLRELGEGAAQGDG